MELLNKYISYVIKNNIPVYVFLSNGVKLNGWLVGKDCESVALANNDITQIIMLSAVATIMPQSSFDITDIMEKKK